MCRQQKHEQYTNKSVNVNSKTVSWHASQKHLNLVRESRMGKIPTDNTSFVKVTCDYIIWNQNNRCYMEQFDFLIF
jgi:hypothetical protein